MSRVTRRRPTRPRRVLVGALGLLVALGASPAAGQEPPAIGDEVARDDAVDSIVGGYAGLAAGGRTTPGGLAIAGSYLTRLTEVDWFDASASFTFGGGGAACFRDRDDSVLCDHGLLRGFAAEVAGAVRQELAGKGSFRPFLKLGLALRLVSFPDDDVRGVAVPLLAGGGVRARVAPHVQVVGAAELRLGIARMGRGVGVEPHLALAVLAGVEFELH
jgi:hypothetical protein